jgi:hypothetical protein
MAQKVPMSFTPKNAGKWVAGKDGNVVAASPKLDVVTKKVQKREDRTSIRFDRVPKAPHFVGTSGM